MRILTLLLIIPFLLAGCGSSDSESAKHDDSDMMIYTSIYPLQYFAERIGGDKVSVQSIVPPGSDGHTFEPTTKELIEVAEADLLIYNGAGFEGFIEKAKESLKEQEVKFINSSAGIEPAGDGEKSENEEHDQKEHHEDHGTEDPHVWLDPLLAIGVSEMIKDAMVEEQPELESEFEKNFDQLKKDLLSLHESFQKVVDEAEGNTFIVAHSAYGRWEKRYGLEQVSVSGISPSHEPSQKEVQELIDFARSNHISHILLERNISSNITEMIGEEINAEILYLSNLESLTQQQLDQGEDYLSVMHTNIETLRKALN
ncbi:metal ABC transporter solute-binding protein, Zn/Mn family [Alkalihalobacillus sp. AL-G]|uniref:metal ABC transporter solute-binding protein, Zn/Mn family n=1 Tax=Alkalihalobacillus sp. AL-G TaxID=2926399 RepID=UPI00272A0E19|nr:zinc ABC transporter substrate-binding protein [Alkalihalobacillus sp. AL-G]WLD91969.1 zinc ABC transporter substrate-binding protein [Alkalihalobacillus sp. AL-G]